MAGVMNGFRGLFMAARTRVVTGPGASSASGSCSRLSARAPMAVAQQTRFRFNAPSSYVFGKVEKPVKPVNRIVRKIQKSPNNPDNPVAKMQPYNRETKKYNIRRLIAMDPDDRMREAIAERRQKKLDEKQGIQELANTPPPRQQIGEIRNFSHGPRKVNSYAKLIRKMSAMQAAEQLTFMQHLKGARCVLMCLMTAIKNAKHNQGIEPEDLWVSHSWIGQGNKPRKELDIRGRGRFGMIKHRKTHYFIVLEEGKPPVKKSKFIPRQVLTRWVHDRPAPSIRAAT